MKKSFVFLIGILNLTWAVESSALPHRLVFDSPVTLKGENIAVGVDLVRDYYDKGAKSYQIKSEGLKTHMCTLEINLEGRDWASQNKILGDHYYGTMIFSCDKSVESGRKGFKSYYSYVQVVGLENCYFSETMRGDDYCNLAVIAYKTKLDLASNKNVNLITKTDAKKDLREYYQIHSEAGWKAIQSYGLIPIGLNPMDLLAVQVFGLNLSKNNSTAAIPSLQGQNLSNLRVGRVHPIQVPVALAEADAKTIEALEASETSLKQILASVQSAPNPQEKISEVSADFFSQYATHAENLLRLLNASNFSRYRAQQLEIEKHFLDLANQYSENKLSLNRFRREYGQTFESYRKADSRLNRGRTDPRLKQLLQSLFGPSYIFEAAESADTGNFAPVILAENAPYIPSPEQFKASYSQTLADHRQRDNLESFPHAAILVLKKDFKIGPNMGGKSFSTDANCTFKINLNASDFSIVLAGTAFLVSHGNTQEYWSNSRWGKITFYKNPYFESLYAAEYRKNDSGDKINEWVELCGRQYFDIYYPTTAIGK